MRNFPTRTCRRGLVVVSRPKSARHGCKYNQCPSISLTKPDNRFGFDNGGRNVFHSHSIHSTRILGIRDRDEAANDSTDDGQQSFATHPAPGGKLSIVFTDIVESTQLWEKDSEAMAIAMRTHDKVVRSLTERHKGYEVKQNGDGFMIAFPTSISALQFCLDVQQQFLEQSWPEELLKLPPSKETSDKDGHILFRGLRLRMGAHWGTPVCVWNHVIKRMDYLGPMVNRAARFVEVTEGGQIVVSEEFILEVQKAKREIREDNESGNENQSKKPVNLEGLHCKEPEPEPEPESTQQKQQQIQKPNKPPNQNPDQHKDQSEDTKTKFEIRLLGNHQFKGLSEPQKLYFIIPESLRGRLNSWPQHRHVPGSKGNIIPQVQ